MFKLYKYKAFSNKYYWEIITITLVFCSFVLAIAGSYKLGQESIQPCKEIIIISNGK